MAVYTDINEIELAAYLENYDIGTLLSYKGIAEGVENSNYLLRTSEGTFILTLYEKRVDRDDLPFFIRLMQHLAVNGIASAHKGKNFSRIGIQGYQRPLVGQF